MPTLKRKELLPIADGTGQEQIGYFLGAGFSKASKYQLPTAEGFLSRDANVYCRDQCNEKGSLPVSDHRELSALLSRLEARYGKLNTLNLESVMSDLYERTAGIGRSWGSRDKAQVDRILPLKDPVLRDAAPDGIPLEPPPEGSDLRRDYELLLLYVCVRLRVVEVTEAECPTTRRLLATVRRRDSIITLNYDTIIERHLARKDGNRRLAGERVNLLDYYVGPPAPGHHTGPTLLADFQPRAWGFFAKLHGSVDWRSCAEPMCPNHWYIESTDRPRPNALEGAEQWHCAICGAIPDTVIIPPVATKPFDRFPKLKLMWLQAYHALRMANRWVFMGVSLAPTDMHLRSLIRAASEDWIGLELPGQICVVNKGEATSKDVADRLWECLSPRVQKRLDDPCQGIATFASIGDYLTAVERTDAERAADPAR